ncbi:MAG TPA: hypothetical protein VIG24_12780 [Acidimicrobiia bacterium]
MDIYETDLSRYTSEGCGVLVTDVDGLAPGEMIAVTDEDADVIAAEVVEIHEGEATIRVLWDKVLHKA